MFHFKVLKDSRIKTAIDSIQTKAASVGSKVTFLDIVTVILENLPELLPLLGNPSALFAAIWELLNLPPLPTPPVPAK